MVFCNNDTKSTSFIFTLILSLYYNTVWKWSQVYNWYKLCKDLLGFTFNKYIVVRWLGHWCDHPLKQMMTFEIIALV